MKKLSKRLIKKIGCDFVLENIDSIKFSLDEEKYYTGIRYEVNGRVGAIVINGRRRAYNRCLDAIHEVWIYFSARGIDTKIVD